MKFQKFKFSGSEITAPPSKSLMVRALAAGLLLENSLVIDNFVLCEDAAAAVKIIEKAGKTIKFSDQSLLVEGTPAFKNNTVFNCKESALSLRLFSPVLALWDRTFSLSGEGSLKSRPADMMMEPLNQLGAGFVSEGGYLPVKIRGPLKNGKVRVDGSVTSQFLSGLLMSLPLVSGDSEIHVKKLSSKTYINLTLNFLEKFKIGIEHREYKTFYIRGGQKYSSENYFVEGDWSGASFFLVMGALGGEITINGLRTDSLQGDRAILDVLESAGAGIITGENCISINSGKLNSFSFDASEKPDLFPPLVALAAGCGGTSEIKGVRRLTHKESNRGEALKKEFGALGIDIRIEGDSMLIKGGRVKGGKVSSHGDHRIAMALITASVIAEGIIDVDDVRCINKSYPGFLENLKKISG